MISNKHNSLKWFMVSIYFSIKHDDIIGIKMIAINNLLTE